MLLPEATADDGGYVAGAAALNQRDKMLKPGDRNPSVVQQDVTPSQTGAVGGTPGNQIAHKNTAWRVHAQRLCLRKRNGLNLGADETEGRRVVPCSC